MSSSLKRLNFLLPNIFIFLWLEYDCAKPITNFLFYSLLLSQNSPVFIQFSTRKYADSTLCSCRKLYYWCSVFCRNLILSIFHINRESWSQFGFFVAYFDDAFDLSISIIFLEHLTDTFVIKSIKWSRYMIFARMRRLHKSMLWRQTHADQKYAKREKPLSYFYSMDKNDRFVFFNMHVNTLSHASCVENRHTSLICI